MAATLTLNDEEQGVLHRILTSYLGDLRMEIADTERQSLREDLHREETILKTLIEQLGPLDTAQSRGV